MTTEEINYKKYLFQITNYIQYILLEKKISRKEFANKMNVYPSEIDFWFKGKFNFDLKIIVKIEHYLNIKIINV